MTADLSTLVGDSGSGGAKGLVPAPGSGDAAANKFLKADGTWATTASGTTLATGGGTGLTTYAAGDMLYAATANPTALSKLADVATGNVLKSGGVGAAPSWGKVDLSADTSGAFLPVAKGGLGFAGALSAGALPYGTSGTAYGLLTIGTTGQVLMATSVSGSVIPQWQDVPGAAAAWSVVASPTSTPPQIYRNSYIRVGGTDSPSYPIDVTGSIRASEAFKLLDSNVGGGIEVANHRILSALGANGCTSKNIFVGVDAGPGTASGKTFSKNSIVGADAATALTTGTDNSTLGYNALLANSTGSFNLALGSAAGSLLTTGSYNIDIGHVGVADEANTIRIGTEASGSGASMTGQAQTFIAGIYNTSGLTSTKSVVIDANGQLGAVSGGGGGVTSVAASGGLTTDQTSGGAITGTGTISIADGGITTAKLASGFTLPVANGGTGATTLTGYVKGTGSTAMTAAATIPMTDVTGTLPHAQLPTLLSADIPANAANTSGTAAGLSATLAVASGGTGLTAVGDIGTVLTTSDGTSASWGPAKLLSDAKWNTGAGSGAFSSLSGDSNSAFGQDAVKNSTGDSNTAIGAWALWGYYRGYADTGFTGSSNVAVGRNAGNTLTSGSENVFIGMGAGASHDLTNPGEVNNSNNLPGTYNNMIAIGRGAWTTKANQMVLGGNGTNLNSDNRPALEEVIPGKNNSASLGSTTNGWKGLYLAASSGTNYLALAAPSTIGTSYTLTLPSSAGEAGQVLGTTTTGSGILSWVTAGGGGGGVTSVAASGGLTTDQTSGGAITGTGTISIADGGITTAKLASGFTLPASKGGTGLASYTAGDILWASGATTLSPLHKGTDGQVLTLTSSTPSWADTVLLSDGRSNTKGGTSVLINMDLSSIAYGRNTAFGYQAMMNATQASDNVAVGSGALTGASGTDSGNQNVAIGYMALNANKKGGDSNIAVGWHAGQKLTTGSGNLLLGTGAGANYTYETNNVLVGAPGVADDWGFVRIGDPDTTGTTYIAGIYGMTPAATGTTPVFIDSKGQLGSIGVVGVLKGGTGLSGYSKGQLLYADAANSLVALSPPSVNSYLVFNTTTGLPGWATGLPASRNAGSPEDQLSGPMTKAAFPGKDGRVEMVSLEEMPARLMKQVQEQVRTIEQQRIEFTPVQEQLLANRPSGRSR